MNINRLLSKGMSNIYQKVTIEKFSKLRFSAFKKFVTRSVFGELQLTHISLNFLVVTKKADIWEENCVQLFYYFNFERNYDVLKLKSLCILLNKDINFNKNKTETIFERQTLCFSSNKNLKLKVKL